MWIGACQRFDLFFFTLISFPKIGVVLVWEQADLKSLCYVFERSVRPVLSTLFLGVRFIDSDGFYF